MEQEWRWPICGQWLEDVIDGVVDVTADRAAREIVDGVMEMVKY